MKTITKTLRILSITVVAVTSIFASEPNQADLTKQQLRSLTATASTPEDHRKLAVYYEQEVQREKGESSKGGTGVEGRTSRQPQRQKLGRAAQLFPIPNGTPSGRR